MTYQLALPGTPRDELEAAMLQALDLKLRSLPDDISEYVIEDICETMGIVDINDVPQDRLEQALAYCDAFEADLGCDAQ